MAIRELIEYHSSRAQKEMGLGLVAQAMPAARAHLQLASLHMQRVRELAGQQGDTAKPPFVM